MRIRAPLWAFPRRWRHRYGAEVSEMFDGSSRPVADWVNLVAVGMRVRWEEHMRSMVTVGLTSALALSLVAVGYTLAELSAGIQEAHRHWWSTAPYVALVSIGAVLLWLRRGSDTRSGC
jgi:hypothetical protein